MGADVLGIGIAGRTLTDLERRILTENSPYAVVLFGRNVGTAEQLRDLVREIKDVSKVPPLIMIDEEGGRVDRLRNLVPGLPSAESFGEGERAAEMSEWLGRVIGMALRYFDIEVNLAPVVDVRGPQPTKGLERRTFGSDPETVVALAGAFMNGQHGQGTASCIKHWPGIGIGSADPHYGATVIDVSMEDLVRRDLVPFARLAEEAGAVMIGHGTYPQLDDPDLPASLSWRLTTDLLRTVLDFSGLAVSDDMEMHAVSDLGSYESIAERALMSGNDVILFCSHIERVPDIMSYLRRRVGEDDAVRQRFDEARTRARRYREHCQRLRRDAGAAVASFQALLDESVRFCEAYATTRPTREVFVPESERRKNDRTPGGRSGREEWT
jgi:beta-N-acetylhexosaminidase